MIFISGVGRTLTQRTLVRITSPTRLLVQAWLGTHSLALSEADWRQLPYICAALAVAGMWGAVVCYASCRFKHHLYHQPANGDGSESDGWPDLGKSHCQQPSYSRVEADDPPSDGELPREPDEVRPPPMAT